MDLFAVCEQADGGLEFVMEAAIIDHMIIFQFATLLV